MVNEPLHEISPEKVPIFLNTLKTCQPDSGSVHATIKKTIDLSEKDPDFRWTLLTTNNGEETGTCIFIIDRGACPVMILYARKGEEARLVDSLKETSIVEWHKNPRIFRIDERLLEPLRSALSSKVKIEVESERIDMMYISGETVLGLPDIPLPEGFKRRNLEENDVDHIAHTWNYGGPEAHSILRYTVLNNTSIGVENEKGELTGWVLWGQCGGLAHLHVNPKCRRKGLGRYLVLQLAKILARNGYTPIMANVGCSNLGSRALLHGVGFQHAFFNYYVRTQYNGK